MLGGSFDFVNFSVIFCSLVDFCFFSESFTALEVFFALPAFTENKELEQ